MKKRQACCFWRAYGHGPEAPRWRKIRWKAAQTMIILRLSIPAIPGRMCMAERGAAGDTTVSGGHVIINGGTVEKQTIGAFAQNSNADVIGNTVEIHGGNVNGENGEIYGGLGTANGTAKENKVLIDGGNIQVATIVGGGIGSMSGSSAQNNYVEIGGNATVNA